jgi:thiamine-phosphate diphosphorylase
MENSNKEGGRIVTTLPNAPFLYAIIDRSFVVEDELIRSTEMLLEGGVDIIQYRAKDLPLNQKRRDLVKIVSRAKTSGVPLIVNDHPQLAAETCASGVHLGEKDPPPALARKILGDGAIIGYTIHNISQLDGIHIKDIDYLAVGSIFRSSTKPEVEPVGLRYIEEVKKRVGLPVVAIGGIKEGNAEDVINSGADGIALISALLIGDITRNCFTFRKIIDRTLQS